MSLLRDLAALCDEPSFVTVPGARVRAALIRWAPVPAPVVDPIASAMLRPFDRPIDPLFVWADRRFTVVFH